MGRLLSFRDFLYRISLKGNFRPTQDVAVLPGHLIWRPIVSFKSKRKISDNNYLCIKRLLVIISVNSTTMCFASY